jgi:hypothetical protein
MKQPIIITGSPHSGTQLINSLLAKAGIFTGADFSQDANSHYFSRINAWILTQMGATWDNPYNARFVDDDFAEAIQKTLLRHLRGKLFTEFLGDKKEVKKAAQIDFDWGWSDPLNVFTLACWKKVFTDPLVIQIYRNPVDVVSAFAADAEKTIQLRKTNKFDGLSRRRIERKLIDKRIYNASLRTSKPIEAYRLWQQYIEKGLELEEAPGNKMHVVRYEELIKNPDAEIGRLFAFLNFKLPDGIIDRMKTLFTGLKPVEFLKDREMLEFYHTIHNQSIMAEMNYHDIV